MNAHRLSAYLMLLAVSVIWGVAGPVIKFTLGEFPPLIFLSYRFAISSVIALVYFSTTNNRLPTKSKDVSLVALYSLLAVSIGLGLLFFGFDKTTSLTGSLLTAMSPIAIVAAGALFLRDHVTGREKIGITLAFVGTLITVVAPLFNGHAGDFLGSIEGNGLIVASILVDTIATLLVKVIMRSRISAETLTHVSFVVGFLTIVPLGLFFHSWKTIIATVTNASLLSHAGVWYMAIVSGTLAYTLRNKAVKTIEVSEASIFSYLYPLWAAPLAVLWLGESITLPFLIGAGVIAVGVGVAEWKKRSKRGKIRL
ncbi:hypothetical protein A3A64_01945 [Candidatus Gottesmanbacteria bacterium RIFCSPLOWO2_01_FULL_48_11]|uniref:EamA domain-containing protein n=2 Tax=Candidatus Gottesmaniibacteriota TaxID=1752720 RepID=A0A0G1U192_9BACT|nr:MAG: hypothetical protein UY16_C0018G0024 [Candidatus Gottesmanbacteria bacterium GW2011_GWA2_47_9]OGG28357.1 MAG: hypothetical protein A3A64_01945 [Candidatus Gottesmanbacteria bacterium RIFCSPLOWO2_01_FULL_48_11]